MHILRFAMAETIKATLRVLSREIYSNTFFLKYLESNIIVESFSKI